MIQGRNQSTKNPAAKKSTKKFVIRSRPPSQLPSPLELGQRHSLSEHMASSVMSMESTDKRRPIGGSNNGHHHGSQCRPKPAPVHGISQNRQNQGPRPTRKNNNDSQKSIIEVHRSRILKHIADHRVTFLQSETGTGKSTAVPQFILDDATARGRRDRVRVIVAQPRRIAAVSLAQYVARSREEPLGRDVGFAVGHDRAVTFGTTRLTFVTGGYLLEFLAHQQNVGWITHIILDEVHVRGVEQDLLLLLLKLLMAGTGSNRPWSSLHATKLIIMSATMDVRPLQEYVRCLLRTTKDQIVDPIIIEGRKFPVDIVHIDEMLDYLPGLPKPVADLAKRLVDISGTGERALDGTSLPRFAIDLVTGLVRNVGRAGDCILVFVATLSDIFDLQEGFERLVRDNTLLALDVVFLHSMLTREEQEMAITPPPPGTTTLKVVIATNIAESSLTIPNVRVVIDFGHQLQQQYNIVNSCTTLCRVWCSKASVRQRAGRAGRLFPGVVLRLFTQETFRNLPEYEKPDIALVNLGSTILQVKSLFQMRFPMLSVTELLQRLLDSPQPEDVKMSMQALQNLGAIIMTYNSDSWELTLLGRLATQLSPDIDLARFVFLGIMMGCGVDCVVMAAGISLQEDIFHQPIRVNKGSMDLVTLQDRRIANFRARMHFDGGYSSNLLVYRQVYLESVDPNKHLVTWIKRSELQQSKFKLFLLIVRNYAQKTIDFITIELGHFCGKEREVNKLRTLTAVNSRCSPFGKYGSVPAFCSNIAIVQIAIAGAFSRNWLIGLPAKQLEAVAEIRDLEQSNMPAHLSFKLRNVPPNLAGADILKLGKALKILAPFHRVLPLDAQTVLVQCELQQEKMTSPTVIMDLPSMAQIASYMANAFSRKGDLILYTKDSSPNAEVEELYVGRPSGIQKIQWTANSKMGDGLRRVQFRRLNLIPSSVEVRKEVPFHIAVAVNLMYAPDRSGVIASLVTVLPQDNLLSVLVLLMFRPQGPEGELCIRLLSKSDRIYSIRFQGADLDLAPRFISLKALHYIDELRSRIQGFMLGNNMENCNLAQDMMNLHQDILRTKYGPPVLALEIGPWLVYPSFMQAKEETLKPKVIPHQSKSAFQQPKPGSHGKSKSTQSSPLLLQSRSDIHRDKDSKFCQGHDQVSSYPDAAKSSDVQLFEQAFKAASLEVNQRQLLEWIGGDRSHNGMYFELLQRLVRQPGDMGHAKAVLQFVYINRKELVNKKQTKELEGLYHSICNPDLADVMSLGGSEIKAAQTVEVHKPNSNQRWVAKSGVVGSLMPQSKEDSYVTRQITVQNHARATIISVVKDQHLAATINMPSNHRIGLVTVSGKGVDVELALQWIKTIIHKECFPVWKTDDTYVDSGNMEEKVRCVDFVGWEHTTTSSVSQADPLEGRTEFMFMLVQDNQDEIVHDHSYARAANSLYHVRMKEVFDKALEGLGPSDSVQLQARLGRVTFTCRNAIKTHFPFLHDQAEPLGRFRKELDRHDIRKRRFDDSISEKDFYHLRACLHLSHPYTVKRVTTYMIVWSNPTARDKRDREGKFKIVDAPGVSGRFNLQGVEKKTRLAAVDIVRLHAGALAADVRISMQTQEDHQPSEEARDYVSRIVRRGSKLEFPAAPYVVHLQRHKESEIFQFDGLKVALIEVKQIRGGVSRRKYEVEFEASGLCSEGVQEEMTLPLSALTSGIPVILQQVQNVCSHMSWIGPSPTATGLAHALLRSWTIAHDETQIQNILIRELLPPPSKSEATGEDQEQLSLQICSLVESFCHCDGRILKQGMDVAAELQLVLLRIVQSMCITLSKSVEGRVKGFLASHKLEPENALQYARLLKCHCSPLDRTWYSVLQPYVMQLTLEQALDKLEEFSFPSSLHPDLFDFSSNQLRDAITNSSVWTILSALTRLFERESKGKFLRLLNVLMTFGEEVGPGATLVRNFVGGLFSYHDSKAAAFVRLCVEWTVENKSSIKNLRAHMQNLLWLLEMLKPLDIFVDEDCCAKVLDLLLRLPSSMERKRDLEETMLEIYGVDEAQFRNLHYHRILQELGCLQAGHKEELKRRGLNEKQCYDFNFQSWSPGKIRGKNLMSSSLIPGLNEGGTCLLGSRGIFIPARDPSGQIIGGQIKVDVDRSGKYLWVSSNRAFNGGKGPQIRGELPLFCCVPRESDTSTVGFCEGGLKAHVLAALSGLPIIGASGADFLQSKNLLESYLAMMDVEKIIFFPDAGSQCNDQVIRCYFRTFRLLREWGCSVRVAWWGQVNKTEHDDIDDYLAKSTCAPELPLYSTSQYWKLVHPDVQEKLQSEFPEYKKPQVGIAITGEADETFTDDDQIKIVKILEHYIAQKTGTGDSYTLTIPKVVMKKMAQAPDDYVTPPSVQNFTIEVLMVQIDDLVDVEAAIDWLLPVGHMNKILGLDCEHGFNGDLNLIQLSTHQRCVLIRLTNESWPHPSSLARILREKRIVKSGAEVHSDALAIYYTMGLMVNGIKNISPAYKTMNRTKGMLEIFRNLYGWEWIKKKDITRSDWGCATLTLEQVKYAALDAWASRMIALEGPGASETSVTSLEDLPEELLKLFARAIANASTLQRREKTSFETSGNISESSRSTLRLLQHSFRSRVTGIGSRVELRFNDGQTPAHFQAQSRTGKSVVLAPLTSSKESRNETNSSSPLPINISAVSSIIVDNSNNRSPQLQRLREEFYRLLCHPDDCPVHLSMALRCARSPDFPREEAPQSKQRHEKATTRKKKPADQGRGALPVMEPSQLMSKPFTQIFASLNDSQREAAHQILTSPLSATIGPPGTGKTRLITAVARAWLQARGEQEILLCTAYQNVAARNLAEALAQEQVSGVLLLVSEDYFVEWHESFYEKLAKSVVITKARCEIPGALEDWRTRNKRSTVPIIVCTLALVGSAAFMSSLMGGKVTAMVIDECSQAGEGSCIYPLTCLPDLSMLTVLGDPYQLPPFSGSGTKPVKVPSIFDLVANGCEVKLLREQYRMPPTICEFISSEIYQNELQTAPARRKEKDWRHPVLWIDIQGVSTKDSGNPSLYNTAEAQAILEFCQKLQKVSKGQRVVVLTLYEEQNRQISTLLAKEKLQELVNVHNVDSFQGQQSDIVLISLVAGRHFSPFAADRNRACVMLSRVKRFLCVFGNYEAVRMNSQALMWKNLAEFCDAHGLVVAPKAAESLLSTNLLMSLADQESGRDPEPPERVAQIPKKVAQTTKKAEPNPKKVSKPSNNSGRRSAEANKKRTKSLVAMDSGTQTTERRLKTNL